MRRNERSKKTKASMAAQVRMKRRRDANFIEAVVDATITSHPDAIAKMTAHIGIFYGLDQMVQFAQLPAMDRSGFLDLLRDCFGDCILPIMEDRANLEAHRLMLYTDIGAEAVVENFMDQATVIITSAEKEEREARVPFLVLDLLAMLAPIKEGLKNCDTCGRLFYNLSHFARYCGPDCHPAALPADAN